MSAYDHTAKLLAVESSRVRYEFWPKHPSEGGTSGVFEFDLNSLRHEIVTPAGDTLDERSVNALVHKLKKHLAEDANPPTSIHFVA